MCECVKCNKMSLSRILRCSPASLLRLRILISRLIGFHASLFFSCGFFDIKIHRWLCSTCKNAKPIKVFLPLSVCSHHANPVERCFHMEKFCSLIWNRCEESFLRKKNLIMFIVLWNQITDDLSAWRDLHINAHTLYPNFIMEPGIYERIFKLRKFFIVIPL